MRYVIMLFMLLYIDSHGADHQARISYQWRSSRYHQRTAQQTEYRILAVYKEMARHVAGGGGALYHMANDSAPGG